MTTNPLLRPPDERWRFLAQTVMAEAALLTRTDARVPGCSPFP